MAAAPIVSATPASLGVGDDAAEGHLDCLYVHVDARARRDVLDFIESWRSCCDEVSVDWRSIRRPASALVGLDLKVCCADRPHELRLVFDVRRDAEALEMLANSEAVVIGNRPYGAFANSMVAYGIDGQLLRSAIGAAHRGLAQLVTVPT